MPAVILMGLTNRRRLLIIILCLLGCTSYFIFHKLLNITGIKTPNRLSKPSPAFILDWTGFFGMPLASPRGRNYMAACPSLADKCRFTSDRRMERRADALIFHAVDTKAKDLPLTRENWQRYVFFSHESAVHTQTVNDFLPPHFFNWTMTMSLLSDVPWPYARFENTYNTDAMISNNLSDGPITRAPVLLSSKTGWVAWLVSNCNAKSRREEYVQELSKHIAVDIYGGCGSAKCPATEDCRDMIANKYRFYLAFENSICADYVTEKFWWMLTKDIVVVVLKRDVLANHKPPNQTFIAADDFSSPKQLADYLLNIGNSQTLYEEYFRWRDTSTVVLDDAIVDAGICGLCNSLLLKLPNKSYKNVDDWFRTVSSCDNNFVSSLLQRLFQ